MELLEEAIVEQHEAYLTLASDAEAPQMYKEAMARSDSKSWKEAINKEIALITNKGVWNLYNGKLPGGKKALPSRKIWKRRSLQKQDVL